MEKTQIAATVKLVFVVVRCGRKMVQAVPNPPVNVNHSHASPLRAVLVVIAAAFPVGINLDYLALGDYS